MPWTEHLSVQGQLDARSQKQLTSHEANNEIAWGFNDVDPGQQECNEQCICEVKELFSVKGGVTVLPRLVLENGCDIDPSSMPLIRKAEARDLQFSVSPWHVKQPATQPGVEQIYEETLVPYKFDQPHFSAATAAAVVKTKPIVKDKARPHASALGWQVKKKPALADIVQPAAATPSCTQEGSPYQQVDATEREEEANYHEEPDTVLHGTAVLAFLSNGQLSGTATPTKLVMLACWVLMARTHGHIIPSKCYVYI